MKYRCLDKITVDTSNDFNLMEKDKVTIKVERNCKNYLIIEGNISGVEKVNLRQDLYSLTKQRFLEVVSDFLYSQYCCLHKVRYYSPHMLTGYLYLEKPKGIR